MTRGILFKTRGYLAITMWIPWVSPGGVKDHLEGGLSISSMIPCWPQLWVPIMHPGSQWTQVRLFYSLNMGCQSCLNLIFYLAITSWEALNLTFSHNPKDFFQVPILIGTTDTSRTGMLLKIWCGHTYNMYLLMISALAIIQSWGRTAPGALRWWRTICSRYCRLKWVGSRQGGWGWGKKGGGRKGQSQHALLYPSWLGFIY